MGSALQAWVDTHPSRPITIDDSRESLYSAAANELETRSDPSPTRPQPERPQPETEPILATRPPVRSSKTPVLDSQARDGGQVSVIGDDDAVPERPGDGRDHDVDLLHRATDAPELAAMRPYSSTARRSKGQHLIRLRGARRGAG